MENTSPADPEIPLPMAYGSRVVRASRATTNAPNMRNFLERKNFSISFPATVTVCMKSPVLSALANISSTP